MKFLKFIYQNDDYFVLIGGNEIVILSESRLRGVYPIKISENEYISCNLENEVPDGGFYCYKFIKTVNENNNIVLMQNKEEPFYTLKSDAGNTLKTAYIIDGYHSDGWIGKLVNLKSKREKKGK